MAIMMDRQTVSYITIDRRPKSLDQENRPNNRPPVKTKPMPESEWAGLSEIGAGEALAQSPEPTDQTNKSDSLEVGNSCLLPVEDDFNLMTWLLDSFAANGLDGGRNIPTSKTNTTTSNHTPDSTKSHAAEIKQDTTDDNKPVSFGRLQPEPQSDVEIQLQPPSSASESSASIHNRSSPLQQLHYYPRIGSGYVNGEVPTPEPRAKVNRGTSRRTVDRLLDELTAKVNSLRDLDNDIMDNLIQANFVLKDIKQAKMAETACESPSPTSRPVKLKTSGRRRRQPSPAPSSLYSRLTNPTGQRITETDNSLTRSVTDASMENFDSAPKNRMPFRGFTMNSRNSSTKTMTIDRRPTHNGSSMKPMTSSSTSLLGSWNMVDIGTDETRIKNGNSSKWRPLGGRSSSVCRQSPEDEKKSNFLSGTLGRWGSRKDVGSNGLSLWPSRRNKQATSQLSLNDWGRGQAVDKKSSEEPNKNSTFDISTLLRNRFRRQSTTQRVPPLISAPLAGSLKHQGKYASLINLGQTTSASSAPQPNTPITTTTTTALLTPTLKRQDTLSARPSLSYLDKPTCSNRPSLSAQAPSSRFQAATRHEGEVDSDSGKFSWDSNGSSSARAETASTFFQ